MLGGSGLFVLPPSQQSAAQLQWEAAQQNRLAAYSQMRSYRNLFFDQEALLQAQSNWRAPPDTRPEWLRDAYDAVTRLENTLTDCGVTRALDWRIVRHDRPLLAEAYKDAPDAPETEQAARALKDEAERVIERVKERRTMRGISAALALLWRLAPISENQ